MATERRVYSKRVNCKRFCRRYSRVQLFYHNCNLSLLDFKLRNVSLGATSLDHVGSKFQVLLHDFSSLRRQCQENCPFYCALQERAPGTEGISWR